MATRRKARGNRSGPSLTDEQRAVLGYGRITLRLPLDALDMLQQIADDMDESRAVAVDTLIRMEHERSFARRDHERPEDEHGGE